MSDQSHDDQALKKDYRSPLPRPSPSEGEGGERGRAEVGTFVLHLQAGTGESIVGSVGVVQSSNPPTATLTIWIGGVVGSRTNLGHVIYTTQVSVP